MYVCAAQQTRHCNAYADNCLALLLHLLLLSVSTQLVHRRWSAPPLLSTLTSQQQASLTRGLQGLVELMSHLAELPHRSMLDRSYSGLHNGGRADSWDQLVPCLKRFSSLFHLNVLGNGHQSDRAGVLLATAMGTVCKYFREQHLHADNVSAQCVLIRGTCTDGIMSKVARCFLLHDCSLMHLSAVCTTCMYAASSTVQAAARLHITLVQNGGA